MRTDCHRHLMEPAFDVCGMCAEAFCSECLVYPFGPRSAPLCIPCAARAAGLSRRPGRPAGRAGRRHKALVEERRTQIRNVRGAG